MEVGGDEERLGESGEAVNSGQRWMKLWLRPGVNIPQALSEQVKTGLQKQRP